MNKILFVLLIVLLFTTGCRSDLTNIDEPITETSKTIIDTPREDADESADTIEEDVVFSEDRYANDIILAY